jgi:hypothetical protein
MSKKRETQDEPVTEAKKTRVSHTTILHLHNCEEPTFPYVFRYDSDVPLTDEQLTILINSTPTSRGEFDVELPGYDPVEDKFDKEVWVPIELEENALVQTSTPTTNIYAWDSWEY